MSKLDDGGSHPVLLRWTVNGSLLVGDYLVSNVRHCVGDMFVHAYLRLQDFGEFLLLGVGVSNSDKCRCLLGVDSRALSPFGVTLSRVLLYLVVASATRPLSLIR